jgi:hypothetical protein
MEMKSEQKTKIIINTKANILAIASVAIMVLWFVSVASLWSNHKGGIGYYMRYSGRLCGIVAILCGIISIKSNKKIKASFWCKPMAISGCILAIYLNFAVPSVLSDSYEVRNYYCERNFKTLSTAIKAYCEKHNGEFPDPAKWCDLLLSEPPEKSDDEYDLYWKLSEKIFKCRAIIAEERYVYAFNKNLAGKHISEVDPNVVVIFESNTVGWNQNGDSKMICPDRHNTYWEESGSYVLCPNQYDVRFVPQSEVKNLRWNP